MEGTHNPIKRAPCFSPLNHITSENTRHKNAADSIMTSIFVSFFSIIPIFLQIKNG